MASSCSNTLTVCRASAGTGKTYTLAATYVALLFSGESYRSILAVTFTNKATQEMKDRILLFLDNIAHNTGEDADDALKAVRSHMIRNTSTSDDKLREMAGKLYRAILEDYDNMHISTIDTFLMQLLNGLGQMLDNATAGARVELDLDQVIAKAVDNLLTRPLNGTEKMTRRLSNYVADKLEDGHSWDVRAALKDIAQNMYNESVQQMDSDEQIVFDAEKILAYRKGIDYRAAQCYKDLKSKIDEWQHWSTEADGVKGFTALDKFVAKVGLYFEGSCKPEDTFKGYTAALAEKVEGDYLLTKYRSNPAQGEKVRAAMMEINALCKACRRAYVTHNATIQLLGDMALMADIRNEIRAILSEQNLILLAQTANTLNKAMKKGDADFILEKVGIRYNHIMLDEFQDTSVLQWENFKPLLEEILANGGTVFIVGDIKQSIYRWRNGDWTIMKNLGKETPYLGNFFQDKTLNCNFRSQKQIVEFNVALFQKLAQQGYIMDIDTSTYTPSNDGGYVQLQFVPYGGNEAYAKRSEVEYSILTEVFQTIAQCLEKGEKPSDMLLLVRTHSEAQKIVDFYRLYAPEVAPLQNAAIVSCDSFQLDTSTSVLMIIHALRWLFKQDEVSKAYLSMVCPDLSIKLLEAINTHTPLCELLEEVICLIPTSQPQDLAYINCLLDCAHDFVGTHDPSTEAFLEYWEDTLHKVSIAAPQIDAIRIMTVHTSKGLEAPNVFIPFCHWKLEKDSGTIWCQAKGLRKEQVEPLQMIPIKMKKDLAESDYEDEITQEHNNQHIDNINALYVALTRARKSLYVYGAYQKTELEKNSTVAALLCNLYGEQWTAESSQTSQKSSSSTKMQDRFSFADATTQMAELHVGERPISFRLSRESMDCLKYGVQEGEETFSRIDLGNVCHGIMEHIETREDEDAAIKEAQMSGLVPDEDTLTQIRQLIAGAWENEKLCDWFSGKWELLREVTFLTANKEMRPDRIMIDKATSTAIVLDYKFGQHHDPQYFFQVRDYMRIMIELGYRHVEGYLWFAQENKLQSVQLK